jgi:putative SOS response-associated peptidase YedK
MVEQRLRAMARDFGADVDWRLFEQLFRDRLDRDIKVSRALEANFLGPQGAEAPSDFERLTRAHVDAYRARLTGNLESEVFKQKKRLADAQRSLQTKETKRAREDERIAQNKIDTALRRLADLKRTEPLERDRRIFPLYYAPVLVEDDDKRWIRPMRYTCRLAGKPASYDVRYPGTYNARRDNFGGFWKALYGHHHAILVITSFFENVASNVYEKRELKSDEKPRNLVLHFDPEPRTEMLVACLWSHWTGKGEPELNSFAAITDDPPPEIAATGHNRCVIPIKRENLDTWLRPESVSLERLDAILSDRERPFYEHRIAA